MLSCVFQPALPMRGVTGSADDVLRGVDISTRTPHAGSDRALRARVCGRWISTRTPHAGSDVRMEQRLAFDGEISTRTPHAGSDVWRCILHVWARDFNPHSPCGE